MAYAIGVAVHGTCLPGAAWPGPKAPWCCDRTAPQGRVRWLPPLGTTSAKATMPIESVYYNDLFGIARRVALTTEGERRP